MIVEELTTEDRATLDALMRTEFQPQIRDLLDRLGSNAAAKIIAYAKRDAPHVAPTIQRLAKRIRMLRAEKQLTQEVAAERAKQRADIIAAFPPVAILEEVK